MPLPEGTFQDMALTDDKSTSDIVLCCKVKIQLEDRIQPFVSLLLHPTWYIQHCGGFILA